MATGRAVAPTKAWALKRAAQLLVGGAWTCPSRDGLPRSPQGITPEWLSAVLCPGVPGAAVTSVARHRASSGTTTRGALTLTYNPTGASAGLPAALFVKCTTSMAQRLMLGLGRLIAGEPGFYTHVRPSLEIEAPRGYFAGVEPRSWHSLVLLEDVNVTRGACFWGPATQISKSEVQDLLSQAAVWHGALWDSPRLAGWPWLKTPSDQMQLIDALIGLANRLPAGSRRAEPVLPARLRHRQADLYLGLRRSMQIASQGPRTYLHGDLHVANTYRTVQGRMGIIDWQVGLQGSWAFDYAYLVATALAVEERRAWERELLHFYLERLVAAGGERISPAEGWLAYRQATLYPYFTWVYTIGRSRLQPRFQPDAVSLVMIERIATAIADLDSLGAVGL